MMPAEKERIQALARSDKPLVVVDIDEVVLEFVAPFMAFLESQGHELRPDSFRLTGNIYFKETGQAAEKHTVSDLLERFFAEHDTWQSPVEGALDTLAEIGVVDADLDYTQSYTTEFVCKGVGMDLKM